MLPPVLEVYVVFHPHDKEGAEIAQHVFDHFHGTAYSGLIGGAVEVYSRSQSWLHPAGAPRPIPVREGDAPNGVPVAALIAIVPVLSGAMSRAAETDLAWRAYLEGLVGIAEAGGANVGLFPTISAASPPGEGFLVELFGARQQIGAQSGLGAEEPHAELLCRDLAQGIAQIVIGADERLQVFISHTRRPGEREEEEDVFELVRRVRTIIANTRLREFFDASDLQPGQEWERQLLEAAATSALLAVRTDLYASRAWCQQEMLVAKRAGMPVVILDSLGHGEERGSFLMDHVARIPVRGGNGAWQNEDIRRGLNLLVDECLRRVLWNVQQMLAEEIPGLDVSWWAPHAPEPVTLVEWVRKQQADGSPALGDADLHILHPDPPLGAPEQESLSELAQLMGHRGALNIMTPRGLAARGG